ncbi:MAG TPA: DUF3160 domain-containing protein [bacterium]|nr:DUF3160 domain-containing protein [bacterium]HPR87411.1 DUF3160 domain-containing protein [bacterium]
MKKIGISLLALLFCGVAAAQHAGFDPAAYQQFLAGTRSLTASELALRYPAGRFEASAPIDWRNARYADSIALKLQLTEGEKSLLQRHGFMVSERLTHATFVRAFADIYTKDLPIFISADAILHAVHASYDEILRRVELQELLPALVTLLESLHNGVPLLAARHPDQPELQPMIRDLDLYLAVARNLLDQKSMPFYKENKAAFGELLALIADLKPASYPLFAATPRKIDFSQFQVRGHYLSDFHPELARYFRAMMWLGRTEFYLIAPREADVQPTFAEVQRQIIDALLLRELLDDPASSQPFAKIEQMLAFFIGECDNVTPQNLAELRTSLGLSSPVLLLDSLRVVTLQQTLAASPFAWQRINTQMLISDPLSPDTLRPASAFLLFGQRFIIDSYILGQVVYDKISYDGQKVTRMLPSTLDVLFGLGNDAAGQLLQPQLEAYHYAPNLAAVRYLIDGYDQDFWTGSLFNHWLAAIRTLNPPSDRTAMPPALRTAAWWQRMMNTQLASWAELRHDNILYGKQSYSGMTTCAYPEVYIEPIPALYAALGRMARAGAVQFAGTTTQPSVYDYFQQAACTFDTLQVIAGKINQSASLEPAQRAFLQRTLFLKQGVCGEPPYTGWYPALYVPSWESDMFGHADYLVADIHTSPTDAAGNLVGWVQHVGTGPVNIGVVVLPLEGQNIAFAAPMLSYYEHLTTNFQRLTDEEWAELYALAPSLRPAFVNSWLADSEGRTRSEGTMLLTSAGTAPAPSSQPVTPLLTANWPNPFNSATLIRITLPPGGTAAPARLEIYDRRGRRVRLLFSGQVSSGHYLARWDGCDEEGRPEPSGIYFYRFTRGEQRAEGKMSLVR